MALPIDQMPIGEGRHPNGEPGATFYVDRNALTALEENGPESKLDDGRFIPEAIGEPGAIFEGLKRENHHDSFCYSVRPALDPVEPDAPTLPRYGFVFLAFARLGIGGYVVFDWEWREEDSDDPGHPLRWQNDFTRRTWPTTSKSI